MSKQKEEKLAPMDGPRKAAAFLLSLDSDLASQIMQQLSERDVALITEEMAKIGELSGGEMTQALTAFSQRTKSDSMMVEPALNALLERTLGRDKAKEMLTRLRGHGGLGTEPFHCLGYLAAGQVSTILREEHPQVQALVISHLDPQVAATILKGMEEDGRYEVVKRMASSEDLPPDLVHQVDEMIESRAFGLSKLGKVDKEGKEGNTRFKTVAQVLNITEPALSKAIIERLSREAPVVANEIQALMFVFDDLLKIGDRDIQKILTEIDKADLTLALKTAPQEIADKFFNNLSERARENLKEDIEILGPKPLHDVEDAQKRITQQVRQMEERGEIVVHRDGGEVMV
jgi:flagellar motor switch protein FliG